MACSESDIHGSVCAKFLGEQTLDDASYRAHNVVARIDASTELMNS